MLIKIKKKKNLTKGFQDAKKKLKCRRNVFFENFTVSVGKSDERRSK